MQLLFDSDYQELKERGLTYAEDERLRCIVFRDFELPESVYVQSACDVLVVIPQNYNQAGNDMFWTFPRLDRANGEPIPRATGPECDPRTFEGKVFCRWSRHWLSGNVIWRPGKDNIVTIINRITWAFNHPEAA